MKRRWQILLGVLFSLGAIIFLFRGIEIEKLTAEMSKFNYWSIIPFAILETLSLWARGMRWRVLLEEKVSGTRLFWITNISYYLSNILPLRIGELGRVYLVTRNSDVTGMQALSTAVLERMLDVVTVFIMLFLVLPFVPEHGLVTSAAYLIVGAVMVVIMGLFAVARNRKRAAMIVGIGSSRLGNKFGGWINEAFEKFFESIDLVRGRRVVMASVWSIVIWIFSVVSTYYLLLSFSPAQKLYGGVFVTALLALGIALPSVPASVGIWEASAVAALAVLGVNKETALAFAIMLHLIVFIKMAILGIIGLYLEGENLNDLVVQAKKLIKSMRN
ncbi:MAG: hypothetical protein CL789_04095 [Chloroflexi bacterium]|nr:hypothetical protein [Chloroflexota bacterium]HCU79929.1 hypothetical protein [Chloroflexota bacterium]